jgi:guanylate kinase
LRGRLVVVSGPSGAGKSTLIKEALAEVPQLAYSVSATTRAPREGEIDGREYFFLSRGEFERRISEGSFLEWAEYSGNLYGTPEYAVEESLVSGHSVILEIELQGARKVHEKRPDAVMVFVRAPSIEETQRRLEGRATETPEALEQRMTTALTELRALEEFDAEIVNGDRGPAREKFIETLRETTRGGSDAERA